MDLDLGILSEMKVVTDRLAQQQSKGEDISRYTKKFVHTTVFGISATLSNR